MNELEVSSKKLEKVKKEKEDDDLTKLKKEVAYLKGRVTYCEGIAKNYAQMFTQLESHLKTLNDRQSNIQAVYDYMMKVGSSLGKSKPNPNGTVYLNPNDDPKRLKE